MHEDLRGTGVGVTTVFPGFIADAGMWADGGLDLPRGVRPSKPAAVADAVIKGIEKDKPEIDVATRSSASAACSPARRRGSSPRSTATRATNELAERARRAPGARSARAGRSSGRG